MSHSLPSAIRVAVLAFVLLFSCGVKSDVLSADSGKPLKLLYLGDNGHHQPAARFKQLQPVMAARGIELSYSDRMEDVNAKTLGQYDGLLVYANIDKIEPDQEKALLEFVAGGKGFVPLHCASYCFRNSDAVVALMGGQFQKHGTGVFRVAPGDDGPKHPITQGYRGFESWDETYVHTKHNEKDRTVLEYRTDENGREPWTWVRTHGKGRVFYTAWGHDERTWSNPGFENLIERGIRWACGGDPSVVPAFADRPQMTPRRKGADVKPFEYVDANVPYYPAGKQWGTLENGKRQMQKPVSAEESMKHMVTPVGFEVKLFTAEPQLGGKPLCMTWDERGRLFVAESYDYPNELQPGNKGRDRIRICEDTDGDGQADKFTVFAEKLSIPTSLAIYRGGVICQNGNETIYLKDTDGDGAADLRKVLVTGWGIGDTHGGVSNFRYGLDNWYYAMQGYNNSEPRYDGGRKTTQSFRQGFFRFRVGGEGEQTEVTEIEFLRSTNNNTWGLGISEEGLIFGSTANGNPSEFMPIPNRYYEAVRGWSSTVLGGIAESNKFEPLADSKVRQVDHHGGFTAAAGHALYTARNYPREYWNRAAFVTEPTGHMIATFILRPDGAGFRSKNSWNLLASDDEWTAPIMAEVGPDGNVWIIDWYNYIVQHNPTPAGFKTGKGNAYESELRDKKHGRIYRLVYRGESESRVGPAERRPTGAVQDGGSRASTHPTNLARTDAETLVATLKHTNQFWRLQAQRLLVERGQRDVLPALLELARDQSVDEIGLNVGVIHALWTLHGLGVLDGSNADATALAVVALKHKSAGVRRNALLVLPRRENSLDAVVKSGAIEDADAQVRLAALLTLADLPSSAAAADAVRVALAQPTVFEDRWLKDAAVSAAAKNDFHFLQAVIANSGAKLVSPGQDVLAIVAEHYARGTPVDSIGSLLATLSQADQHVSSAILDGLLRGWPKGKPAKLDDKTEAAFAELLPKLAPAARGQFVMLATRLGSKQMEKYSAEISAGFLAQVRDDKQSEKTRLAAAVQLIEFRKLDSAAPRDLLDLITPRTSPELAAGLLDAIGHSDAPEAGAAVVETLGAITPATRPTAIRVLLQRADWADALLAAVEAGQVRLAEISLVQQESLSAHPNQKLASRAKKLRAQGGGLPNPDRQKVVEELLPLTKRMGDAVAGKEVFKKQCSKCHTHGGEGAKIGPDLTGLAVLPKHELLIRLIDPSRSVEVNYRVYTVVLDDGRVLTGLLASESKTTIEIFDAEGKKHAIQRDEVERLVASTKSLMPDGFEKQVTPDEIANLLEFLTQRGKFLPIPLGKAATIVSTKGMFNSEDAGVERLIFADWSPKIFEGVPFVLVDPQGERVPNVIMLHGANGNIPPKMPKQVSLPCNAPAKAIHFLSGVSGWGWPASEKDTVTLIVRLKYADGQTEDHPLKNGEHFADYIRRVDVPGSKFAYPLRSQQIRYLTVFPQRPDKIETIELVKGKDVTSPVVMAVTVEGP